MNEPSGRPLNVLALGTTFPAIPGDGTPEFVLTLSSELAARGHQVTVLVPQIPGAARSETINGLRVKRFRYFPRRFEDLAHGAVVPNLKARPSRWLQVPSLVGGFLLAARREVRRGNIDVVHAHWVIPAGLIARLIGRPYVITAHGGDAYAFSGAGASRIKKLALHAAKAVVPVSDAIGQRLAALGANVSPAVPMGVDIEAVAAAVGERRPVAGSILFVGRLVDKKGVDDLLRAIVDLPDATVRIVGDGPSRPALKTLADELEVADRVTFLGQQPRAVVLAEMAAAALVALPSKVGEGGDTDGVPVVLSEAMAARLPVVCSDAGGLSEHVVDGQNGWLVPAGSVADLRGAIAGALADPAEAERRAERAKDTMAGELGLAAIGDRYDAILRAAAG
jgi:glycosyltransferase involved in cell wall biosynthesis